MTSFKDIQGQPGCGWTKAGLGPPWQTPGSEERARDAGTLRTLAEAGLMSRASAVGMVAAEYGLADAGAELRRIALR